jgi:MFS family permease
MKENPLAASGFVLEKILPVDVKRATIVAFFAWVFAVYDFILFGTLLPEIGKHYGWDAPMQAEIATFVAIGTAVIAFAIGPVLDRAGSPLDGGGRSVMFRADCCRWCARAVAARADPLALGTGLCRGNGQCDLP